MKWKQSIVTTEAFVEIRDVVFRRDQRVIYDGLTASVPEEKSRRSSVRRDRKTHYYV